MYTHKFINFHNIYFIICILRKRGIFVRNEIKRKKVTQSLKKKDFCHLNGDDFTQFQLFEEN